MIMDIRGTEPICN